MLIHVRYSTDVNTTQAVHRLTSASCYVVSVGRARDPVQWNDSADAKAPAHTLRTTPKTTKTLFNGIRTIPNLSL